MDPDLARGDRTLGPLYVASFLVPIALASIVPVDSILVSSLIVPAFIAFTIVGRWETVVVLRGRPLR